MASEAPAPEPERAPAGPGWQIWAPRVLALIALLCLVLAFVSGITKVFIVVARPATLIEAAIAFAVLALYLIVDELWVSMRAK